MDVADRIDPFRAWLGTVVTIAILLVGGSLLLPRQVYDGFIWHYFWGPVVADANSAVCAVKIDGVTRLLGSSTACTQSPGIVAYPGYTLVSEVGYMVTLLLALLGVVYLLRYLRIGEDRQLFFGLLPFMFLGGALRVVEDANDAVPEGIQAAITYPWNTLIISPVIYFTMFFIALATLLVSVWLEQTGQVDRYDRILAGFGGVALAGTVGYLFWLSTTTTYVAFYPQISVVVLLASVAITGLAWYGIERFRPRYHLGTGSMGAVVLFAHSVDGVANVVGIDWAVALGLPANLVPKHPVNRALIGVGEMFPTAVTAVIGTAWPFLVVKIAVAIAVIAIFDETIFEDSPRYAILLMIAVVAVGLGPGTRDMLRATFGI